MTAKNNSGFDVIIESPVGKLGFCFCENEILNLEFLPTSCKLKNSKSAAFIVHALETYFRDANYRFELNYELQGTPFQKRVWRALTRIPTGKTLSYGELAKKLDTSARAIGNACRTNPLPIIIPCHRVIGSDGKLCGFAGKTSGDPLARKRWLLRHEGVSLSKR